MSTKIVDTRPVDSRILWKEAISFAEALLETTKNAKRRAGLIHAIRWFRHRLKMNALYPGIKN